MSIPNAWENWVIQSMLDELDDKDDYYQMLQQKRKRRHVPTSYCFPIHHSLNSDHFFISTHSGLNVRQIPTWK
jgi:hypothetical protein